MPPNIAADRFSPAVTRHFQRWLMPPRQFFERALASDYSLQISSTFFADYTAARFR